MTGTDAWSWDAPFVHTAPRYVETHDARLVWEGHKAGREIGLIAAAVRPRRVLLSSEDPRCFGRLDARGCNHRPAVAVLSELGFVQFDAAQSKLPILLRVDRAKSKVEDVMRILLCLLVVTCAVAAWSPAHAWYDRYGYWHPNHYRYHHYVYSPPPYYYHHRVYVAPHPYYRPPPPAYYRPY